MKTASYTALLSGLLLTTVLALPVAAAVPPGNGAGSYDIMMHSAGDWSSEPVLATEAPWHAFFEAPATPATAPGVTYTDTTDLTTLNSYDMLYITQSSIDALSGADMTTILNWITAGGTLMLHTDDTSPSEFGTFAGPAYAFTSVADPDGNTIVVTDAAHPLLTTPNVLDATDLSDWGSSVHGALSSTGAAYSCAANDTNGVTSLPVLCSATYGAGSIILNGFDPECGCHDDHLDVPPGTNSGSEMWENLLLFGGYAGSVPTPVPTLSTWALGLLVGLLMLGGVVRQRRGARRTS